MTSPSLDGKSEMLEIRDEDGKLLFYHVNAEQDWITCTCGVVVPQGKVCSRSGCRQRTLGPSVENQTRKILTGELDATR